MKEAPSFEGALLVSEAPPIAKAPGVGTGDGGGVPTGPDGSPSLVPSASSLGTSS